MYERKIYEKKSVIIILSCLLVILILINWTTPIAFTKSGLLTEKEVESFDTSYNLAITRRHSEDTQKIYLFCTGTKKPTVNSESNGKVEKVEPVNVFPGLYYWDWEVSDGYAFQVSTNSKNYYFTIVVA